MKLRTLKLTAFATFAALGLAACAPTTPTAQAPATEPAVTEPNAPTGERAPGQCVVPADPANITMWVAGPDTPTELRQYLMTTFAAQNPGSTLTIQEQNWGDLATQLTTALPDPNNTPDVVELGNTQTPTFSTVGAFRPISPELYELLGGENLLQSFVDIGVVDGQMFALPYYFGSRIVFYRPDVWAAAGITAPPATLAELTDAAAALRTPTMSGFAMGGADFHNAIAWIFAHGGQLATVDGTQWTMTLSDPNTIAGLEEWQRLYTTASNVAATQPSGAIYWELLNGLAPDASAPEAATMIAPPWARWQLGALNDAGERDGMADRSKFGVFALPGVDGGVAPVFAGGSNLAISAASQHPQLAENLLCIIFSSEFQTMLGENGLGPANSLYASSLGDDEIAQLTVETAFNSRLTPPAPGWAAVEGSTEWTSFLTAVAQGGNVRELAAATDAVLTPMLNLH